MDVIVIGGGPGGYVAAIRCAQLGLKTTLVEKEHLGGVCLNWGCIPTKALLKSSEIFTLMEHAKDFGITLPGAPLPDIQKMVSRSRSISQQLASGIKHLLKKNNVTVIEGHGKLINGTTVCVSSHGKKDQTVSAQHIILATGARSRTLPGVEPSSHVWLAKQAMTPTEIPKSLVIVGSGAIGMEFASFYNSLGTKVTLIEMADGILPQEDKEISTLALELFKKRGITFHLETRLEKIETKKNAVTITAFEKNKPLSLTSEKLILAMGIVGNTEGLGLETTKIQKEGTQIKVDAYGRTHEPTVFAIGDVVGGPWLAHKASHEGIIVAETIAGRSPKPLDKTHIPGCTYTQPNIASIGLTEEKAKIWATEHNETLKIGRFPFRANGKALTMGESEGLIKLIFAKKSGEFLGAHMIGAEVTELIHSLALLKKLEGTEEDVMHTIFPHPTLSEMLHEAALSAENRAIHW